MFSLLHRFHADKHTHFSPFSVFSFLSFPRISFRSICLHINIFNNPPCTNMSLLFFNFLSSIAGCCRQYCYCCLLKWNNNVAIWNTQYTRLIRLYESDIWINVFIISKSNRWIVLIVKEFLDPETTVLSSRDFPWIDPHTVKWQWFVFQKDFYVFLFVLWTANELKVNYGLKTMVVYVIIASMLTAQIKCFGI